MADNTTGISRELMGKIVDEVFDGAIEDCSVIEEIYAVIKRHEAEDHPITTAKMAGCSAEPDFAASIRRTCSEEASNGAACGWTPCTGCYDTEDGHPTAHYPHSKIFGCDVGSGCSECGGLGVVFQYWSPEDLEDMQRDCVSETQTATQEELSYQCDACSTPGYPPNSKCECTSIQQDESCPVGYPSLLCEVCDGKGIIPTPATHVTGIELPADIIESLLAIGLVEWRQTFCQPDEKHVEDFRDTLRITRENFGIENEETTISYVALEGTGTVLAMTGNSPNSSQHARILVGAWNWLVAIARAPAPQVLPSESPWQWWAGEGEEWLTVGPEDTREAIISAATNDRLGEFEHDGGGWNLSFHIVEARKDPLRLADWIHGCDLLDYAEECLADSDRIGSEFDEGPWFTCSTAQKKDLQERINRACDEWQEAHGLVFSCATFSHTRNEEHVIVELHDDRTATEVSANG